MPSAPDDRIHALMRKLADAWSAGDMTTLLDCYHPEVVFHYFGRNPYAGAHRGKTACIAVMTAMRERVNRRLVSIQDVLAGHAFGVVSTIERFERGGQGIELDRVFRYRLREGKVAECWVYDQDQRLVDEYLS